MALDTGAVLSEVLDENIEHFFEEAGDFTDQPVVVLNPFRCVFWTKRPKWLIQLGVFGDITADSTPEIVDHDMSMHACYGAVALPSLVEVSQISIGPESQVVTEILDKRLQIGLTNFETNSKNQGWRPAKGRLGTFVVAGGKNIRDWLYTTATQPISYMEPWDGKDVKLNFDTGIRRTIETELDILENLR
jgi:hypothetical protein